MLYPDNPKHEKAINYIDPLDNSLYIKHVAKYDEKGNLKNKEHYHCILKYDQPYWLSTLLNELQLDEEDAHLFHSYRDFKRGNKPKYRSLNEYINYLDHVMEDDKEDKYTINDFYGGLKNLAVSIIDNRDKESYLILAEMIEFIQKYYLDHFSECLTWQFRDYYKLCCDNGYGSLFYREWYKMRDILRAYIN